MMVVRSAAMYGLDSCDGFIGSDHKAEKALIRWTIQVEWFGGKVKKAWLGFII